MISIKLSVMCKWNHILDCFCPQSRNATVLQRERERERIYSIKSKRAGVKITPKTFLCTSVSHLSLHRESLAFSSIKSRLCITSQSPHSLYDLITEVLNKDFPFNSTWLGNRPSAVLICRDCDKDLSWLKAASCALNQKMQLSEPILHSPLTPPPPTPLRPFPSLSSSAGCHQNAGAVLRTTHRVIINKRRWQVNIPREC